MNRRRRSAGFSLVELMIAVAILAIVIGAVMQSFVVQNKSYTVTDQVVEAQQSLRAVAWLLERDARMTGYMVPEEAALCAIDYVDAPDRVWFTDSDAIDPEGQTRPALGVAVSDYTGGTGSKTLTVEDVVLDGRPFYDLDNDGDADADFMEGGGAILVNLDDPARGTACGVVQNVAVASKQITIDFQTGIAPPSAMDRVVLVPAHVYEVISGGEPKLRRNGRVVASGVEDLQVAFFFDRDRDGEIDEPNASGGELPGAEGADPYESDKYDNRDLREVHIDLVTRTRLPDVTNQNGLFQARANREGPAVGDGYRRRVHTSTVKVRNVGYRGTAA